MKKGKGKYFYQGHYYTGEKLAQLSGLSVRCVYDRLRAGWSVEDVLKNGQVGSMAVLEEKWRGKILEVKFHKYIPSVFAKMQPVLGKSYVATPSQRPKKGTSHYRSFFCITLDNGKPLIVYPNEFEIIGEIRDVSEVGENGKINSSADRKRESSESEEPWEGESGKPKSRSRGNLCRGAACGI